MKRPRVYWRVLRREWKRNGWEATDTGWLLTLGLFLLILRIGLLYDDGVSKFDQFILLKPSEMGDTLAGLFSALAFIWIIVTVFIQSRELRETRVEVKQQRVASQDMAKALAAQASIFEIEKIQRLEDRAERELEQRLRGLIAWFVMLPEDDFISWVFRNDSFLTTNAGGARVYMRRYLNSDATEDFFHKLRTKLLQTKRRISDQQSTQFKGLLAKDTLEFFLKRLQEIAALEPRLAEDQKIRIRTLGIRMLERNINDVLNGNSKLISEKVDWI